MDYFSLLLILLLCYRNSLKAKKKGLNVWLWGIVTFIAVFVAEMIGAMIVIFYFCRNVIDTDRFVADPSYKDTAMKLLTQAFMNNPLHPLTVFLFGFGGYLLVRYIIDKKTGKKDDTQTHWSDRMGENKE